jgi:hypothetical protein
LLHLYFSGYKAIVISVRSLEIKSNHLYNTGKIKHPDFCYTLMVTTIEMLHYYLNIMYRFSAETVRDAGKLWWGHKMLPTYQNYYYRTTAVNNALTMCVIFLSKLWCELVIQHRTSAPTRSVSEQ